MTGPDEENLLKRYYRLLGEAESMKETNKIFAEFLTSFWKQGSSPYAPVTAVLAALVLIFFGAQIAVDSLFRDGFLVSLISTLSEPDYLRGVTAWIFHEFPFLAWPLSPFLHKGILHFTANIALLALFGKYVEAQFKTRHFILWFIVITLVSKPVHAWISLQMSTKPDVAVYGISDFVFSLAFYSAIRLYYSKRKNEFEYVAWMIGILAVLIVSSNAVFAIWQGSVDPVNPGHFVGGLSGIAVFTMVYRQGSAVLF
jgi:membrane associated rhomboid family serine protease